MTLSPLGDSALVLSWGETVDDAALERVRVLTDVLRDAGVDGVTDVVPAFNTITLYFDPVHTLAPDVLETKLRRIIDAAGNGKRSGHEPRELEIPVCYGGEFGPDLEDVARTASLPLDQVIEQHAGADYVVHATGFVPGFAYLGGLPRKLHTPRRATPRPRVAAGTVGIGGAQTGVYPMVTPGGWNLIGRTPLRLFDLGRSAPALLQAGDRVTFRAISPEEFAAWK